MERLTIEEVIVIHSAAIQQFGGLHGIRDLKRLTSALARPDQTFAGKMLYSTVWLQAAALLQSIAMDHPFVDGNKRTALTVAVLFLRWNGWKLSVQHRLLFHFVIDVVKKRLEVKDIAMWLENHVKKT